MQNTEIELNNTVQITMGLIAHHNTVILYCCCCGLDELNIGYESGSYGMMNEWSNVNSSGSKTGSSCVKLTSLAECSFDLSS